MKKITFLYNVSLFRKKLILRTGIVITMFCVFLAFNTYQLPDSERGKFLMIFLPLFLLLVWFLVKNFSKQLEILSRGRIEVEGSLLKQFDAYGSCANILLKDIEKITRDKFRSYDRLVLETAEKIYPLVNVAEWESLSKILEKETNLKIEIDNSEINYFSYRTFLFFLPSVIFVAFIFIPQITSVYHFINQETAMLFFNVNLIVFFLYLPEKKNYILTGFSFKRRMIFITTMIFFFQVYTNLEKGDFFK